MVICLLVCLLLTSVCRNVQYVDCTDGINSNFFFIAALIHVFILSMDPITTFNVKEVARNNEPTENFNLTLQFPTPVKEYFSIFQFIALVLWVTV